MTGRARLLLGLLPLLLAACAGDARESRRSSAPAVPEPQEAGPPQEIAGERVILVAPGGGRPEFVRLAAELDRAVAEMAPRVPWSAGAPLRVVVEPDHVSQGRRTGDIGPAVPGPEADLHLVHHPDDLFAYRYALAKVLLEKAGVGKDAPPGLRRGAALWLSGDWYGRPWPEWLPELSAARVLPGAEEILAAEDPRDGSEVLWPPAAARVVERLAGATAAEKLKRVPAVEEVREALRVEASPPGPLSRGERGNLTEAASRLQATPPTQRPPSPPRRGGQGVRLQGVSLAMLNSLEGGYHSPSVGQQLERLRGLGANSVSLMPFAFQRSPDKPDLRYLNRSPRGETDIGMIHATRLARSRGFHVLYKPHLWIPGGSWPGDVAMASEEDWARWWKSYRRYILHHAVLARWAGADLFCTGVELSKTLQRPEWRGLHADVRRFFPGRITYAANWYDGLERIPFWDTVDLVGVDAYYPLSPSATASRSELRRGAAAVAKRLAAVSRRFGKPVLLTEVGFAAREAAWVEPHGEGGEYSEEDQALAYEILFSALGRPAWLEGTYVWKAFTAEGGRHGERDADFRFLGREAEEAVREYYLSR